MPKLERIWMYKSANRFYEIRMDWDNGQCLAIGLKNLEPDAVITGLLQVVHFLKNEQNKGNL